MPASAKAVCVDPKQVDLIWPDVSHWIKRAMQRGDLGRFDDVEADVLSGKALLWLAWIWPEIEGAAVTQISRTEKSKVCTIVACGGERVSRWLPLIEKIEEYAKQQDCDRTQIFGRPGWVRLLPDYRARAMVIERRL